MPGSVHYLSLLEPFQATILGARSAVSYTAHPVFYCVTLTTATRSQEHQTLRLSESDLRTAPPPASYILPGSPGVKVSRQGRGRPPAQRARVAVPEWASLQATAQ